MTTSPGLLLDLLNGAGIGGPWAWDRIAIVRSVGALTVPPSGDADPVSTRGFNLILFDRGHRPQYYCKVRHSGLASAVREATTLARLAADPRLRRAVPATHHYVSGPVRVQVSEFLAGAPLSQRWPKMAMEDRARVTEEVFEMMAAISKAPGSVPWGGTPPAVDLAGRARPALDFMSGICPGLSLDETFGKVITAAGMVPVSIQHGDLWPGNILARPPGWVITDFEQFGVIDVPLYDRLHFLRASWGLLAGNQGERVTWLEAVDVRGPGTSEVGQVIGSEAARLGLTGAQVRGLIAFYLVDSAYRLLRRGVPGHLSDPFRMEVENAARQFRRGRGLGGNLGGCSLSR